MIVEPNRCWVSQSFCGYFLSTLRRIRSLSFWIPFGQKLSHDKWEFDSDTFLNSTTGIKSLWKNCSNTLLQQKLQPLDSWTKSCNPRAAIFLIFSRSSTNKTYCSLAAQKYSLFSGAARKNIPLFYHRTKLATWRPCNTSFQSSTKLLIFSRGNHFVVLSVSQESLFVFNDGYSWAARN